MIREFIDRKTELARLEEEWAGKGGRLVILYGRRRIGKTRLITEFARGKPGIFHIAEDTAPHLQIRSMKEQLVSFYQDPLLATLEMQTWDQVFTYLAQHLPEERSCLIIDEFSYLVKNEPGILSAVQKAWDTVLSGSPWFLLFSGSMVGLMGEAALSHASPLYGRRTRDMLLEGLGFFDARQFLEFSFVDSLKTYLITGGVPEYLQRAGSYTDFGTFLEKEWFDRYGYFYREPYFILSQEVRELKIYQSILNSIALGDTAPGKIAQFCGLDTRHLYPYLENMILLGIIAREVPVTGGRRQAIYVIKDRIFDFWYNFIFLHRHAIETDGFRPEDLSLDPYFGKQFEVLVRDELGRQLFPGYRIGRWWYREDEIDLVGLDDGTGSILFGECKWGDLSLREARMILRKLQKKSQSVRAEKYLHRDYGVICAGTIDGKDTLRDEYTHIYDRADLEAMSKRLTVKG